MGEPAEKPPWFKVRFRENAATRRLGDIMKGQSLHSVCESAHCPNKPECWAVGTASFMVMGEACTRACRFCAIKTTAKPPPLDADEPRRLADAISSLGLKYIVITSVTRDDLSDGGSAHIARCVKAVREKNPGIIIETLVPDFKADKAAIGNLVDAEPDVISHNIEIVARLTPMIRDPKADYHQSLETLRLYGELSGHRIITKSGIMVGFGEEPSEIEEAMRDLRAADVEILTIGQYLAPSTGPRHFQQKEYITPETFKAYEALGYKLGFKHVASGPLVRSSYHAAEPFIKGILRKRFPS